MGGMAKGPKMLNFLLTNRSAQRENAGGGGGERTSEGAECKKRGMLSRSLIMQTRPA